MTKNSLTALISLASLVLSACGSNPGSSSEPVKVAQTTPSPSSQAFDPPPAAEGYTRIVAPTIADIEPGTDLMYCQYIQAPLDHDVDILDFGGQQSAFGHHAVAFATTADVPVGTSGLCGQADNLSGAFLGGIGGEGTGGVKLPDGVAFRLPKGNAIMLNTHFLNTGTETIDGQTVVDIRFVDVDPNRRIASFFVNGNMGFNVPPNGTADALAECPVQRDLEFILFTNHMHDQGTHAMTEVVRVDGTTELIHDDPKWTYEMQFNAIYSEWPVTEPLKIAAGDVLRTHCAWGNGTNAALAFPREMCFGVGFFLSSGSDASAPTCINGAWFER